MRILVILCLALIAPLVHAASPEAVHAKHGMVSSRSTLASEAGVEMMRRGGNAVDAAVATAFALAVAHPSAGNLGGGGFAVVRLPSGEVVALDHREMAPGAAHRDMYLDEDGNEIEGLSRASHLASGVPGSVDGLLTLLEAHGTMEPREVIAPAIKLAREGIVLTWSMARSFRRQLDAMSKHPASMAVFSNKGEPYEPGDRWVQPDLAKVLERIAWHGRKGFYEGETADLIVKEMERGGGIITHEDLKNYRSVWREPIHSTYRGYDVWGMPLPSSGGVMVAQMLHMLEPYDLGTMGWGSADLVHLMIEAERRAFADRAEHMGDTDFVEVPVDMMLSRDYAKSRFSNFNPQRASDSKDIGAGSVPRESVNTTHFSVMDASGMMVAFTTTLNSAYGSKIVIPGTGMLMNNEMDDFSIKPNTENQFQLIGGDANAIAPGKRMLSSMTPTLVLRDDKPVLVVGSPGGPTIITTTLQVILNVLDHDMSIEDAVSLPRWHHQWLPNRVVMERYALSPDTVRALKEMGHVNLITAPFKLGDANSILFKDGLMHGIKDPRAEGVAVGF